MAVAVRLPDTGVATDPGSESVCEVRIRNTGQVVDQFMVELVGDPQAWTEVEPATVNLLPGAEELIRLTFRPPRSATVHAGEMPFGVRVRSREDPGSSRVEEGVLVVAPFDELVTELVPRTSRGRRTGRHELILDNNGNHATTVEILAADPDRLLEFRVAPPTLDLAPGTATFVTLRAQPKKRFLRGPNRTLPFQTYVTTEGMEPKTADGAMLQEPLLPDGTMKALALVLVVALALAAFWYAVLRPQVRSEATKAAREQTSRQTASLAADASTAKKQAGQARTQASHAAEAAAEAKQAAGLSPSPAPGGVSNSSSGTLTNSNPKTATDFRITSSVAPGPTGQFHTEAFQLPKRKVLWITDMVLQNPSGDSGTLQIRRGSTVLFVFGLENFRDVDYHFVQPLRFTAKDPVTLAVDCQNPGTTKCTPSAYFDGQLVEG